MDQYVLEPVTEEGKVRMQVKHLLTKADDWRYEREWRHLRENGPGVVSVGPEHVTSVTIGTGMRGRFDEAVAAIRIARPDLPIYRAKLADHKYAMERHLVT